MRRWSLSVMLLLVGGCLLLWAVIAAGCLCVGSTGIYWPEGETLRDRALQTAVASLVGASLAAAGVAYQAILRNPLAEPYLLGVSSGASLAVYVWWSLPLVALPVIGALSQQAFAFAGALVVLAVVFTLAQRRGQLEPMALLLVGVIVNAINGAIFMLLFHQRPTHDITLAFRFLAGGLQSDLGTGQIVAVATCFVAGWTVLLYLAGQLNVATLSEGEAHSLGLRIQRLRWAALIVASLVAASGVAISGPIGFVGLVCPHLGRLLAGTDQRRLLPVATLLGAALLAVADAASRRLGQIPVGVLTGFMGGPFFLLLLWRARRTAGGYRI